MFQNQTNRDQHGISTRYLRTLRTIGLCALLVFGAAQCSNKGKSSKIDLEVTPDQPIVITGDFKIGDRTISSPWFKFKVKVTNNSDEPVTILSLSMIVDGFSTDGQFIEKKATIGPSDANFTMDCTTDITWSVEYDTFGTFDPGESKYLYLVPSLSSPSPNIGACSTATATINKVWLYLGGNPNKDTDHVSSYSYRVTLTPVGWFGTNEEPTDRFEKSIYFSTQ